jgi:hypothetical protein
MWARVTKLSGYAKIITKLMTEPCNVYVFITLLRGGGPFNFDPEV